MCFPTLARENDAIMEAIRVSLVETVRKAIYDDLVAIIDEDVAGPLEELGTLIKNYTGPKDIEAWRPSGDPTKDMMAHDAKVLQHEKQRLLESVGNAKKISEAVLQKVKSGRKKCHNNHVEIQKRLTVLNELETVSRGLSKENMASASHDIFSNNVSEVSAEERESSSNSL
ncbi:uncharacterized protein LOC121876933 isoform X2 [Homarus americanus]|uniref:uncharacterized protein LOC121876933 isoform X2 n=1 Tax=Homarus americanus TaxID=6706 RepID=UPI001C4628D8|nr:uncharacterized protein LOC121876933 isoform X2 [Homarus americanus]